MTRHKSWTVSSYSRNRPSGYGVLYFTTSNSPENFHSKKCQVGKQWCGGAQNSNHQRAVGVISKQLVARRNINNFNWPARNCKDGLFIRPAPLRCSTPRDFSTAIDSSAASLIFKPTPRGYRSVTFCPGAPSPAHCGPNFRTKFPSVSGGTESEVGYSLKYCTFGAVVIDPSWSFNSLLCIAKCVSIISFLRLSK